MTTGTVELARFQSDTIVVHFGGDERISDSAYGTGYENALKKEAGRLGIHPLPGPKVVPQHMSL
jgi:hypothetical protein